MDQLESTDHMQPTQPNQVTSSEPSSPPRKNYFPLKLLLALGGVLLIALLGFRLLSSQSSQTTKLSSQEKVAVALGQVAPTPFPFRELTIPYLRSQTYDSKLGERGLYSNNGAYSSYLTSYTSSGFRVNGLLTIPEGEEPKGGWPAIIFVHGYIPPSLYITTQRYVDYVDYLARNGFVVFKIDLRGHGDSEGEAGGGYYGSDYIADVLNAYAALQSSDFVHPQKVGLWGHSMAGNVILRSMAVKPTIPASVIWAGAVYSYLDQRKYGINDNSYRPPEMSSNRLNRRRELFEKYGSPSAQSVFWQQVAPTNYLNDLKGAVAVHHALDDEVVDIGYTRDLREALDKTEVPHEIYEYDFGGHDIAGSSFSQAMQRTVDFFKQYLSVE